MCVYGSPTGRLVAGPLGLTPQCRDGITLSLFLPSSLHFSVFLKVKRREVKIEQCSILQVMDEQIPPGPVTPPQIGRAHV